MRYQFQIDNRPAGPIRDQWEDAAHDAISAGHGVWYGRNACKLDQQASIARIEEPAGRAVLSEKEAPHGRD